MDPQLAGLIQLCKDYNATHSKSAIDLEEYTSISQLICCLWERRVNTGAFGFGEPFDKALKGWSLQDDEDAVGNLTPRYGLDTNMVYCVLSNTHLMPSFLHYSLMLPKNYGIYYPINCKESSFMLTKNLERFNEFWTKMGKAPIADYHELRHLLITDTLSSIELCYLLFECENYRLYLPGMSMFDFLELIGCEC